MSTAALTSRGTESLHELMSPRWMQNTGAKMLTKEEVKKGYSSPLLFSWVVLSKKLCSLYISFSFAPPFRVPLFLSSWSLLHKYTGKFVQFFFLYARTSCRSLRGKTIGKQICSSIQQVSIRSNAFYRQSTTLATVEDRKLFGTSLLPSKHLELLGGT